MKKWLSFALALVMALALCSVSWAEVTNGKEYPAGGADNDTVYWSIGEADGQSGYATTLAGALKAAYMANTDGSKAITVICKPGADVGAMTHGHVEDDLTIYGNGARVSGGEYDLEVDTYKFDRSTGTNTGSGEYLTKNITINVYDLDGIAIWGERHTDKTVKASFYNCKNMNRAYISGAAGSNELLFDGCSFNGEAGSNSNTSIYSNAAGSVTVKNTTFSKVAVPINLNHKSTGTQSVAVENCSFTACGSTATEGDLNQYAAPIRFVNSGSGTMTAEVSNATFSGTVSNNGDILVGDGRNGKDSAAVNTTVTKTTADLRVQQPGYYTAGATTDDTKQVSKNVTPDVIAKVAGTTEITTEIVPSEPVVEPAAPKYYYKTPAATADEAKGSPKTFDAGVALYAGMALASLTGVAYTAKKRGE